MGIFSFLEFLQEDDAGGACAAPAASDTGSTTTSNMAVNLAGGSGKVLKRQIKGGPAMRVKWTRGKKAHNIVEQFDIEAVESRLRSADKQFDVERKSAQFGIEDANGKVIRVYVAVEQGSAFEAAISQALSDQPDLDVGELLFSMKDRFNIHNVVWPDVAEENEEDAKPGDGEQPTDDNPDTDKMFQDPSGDMGGDPGADLDGLGVDDMAPPAEQSSDADAQSVLKQVLDMLRAEADARRAEAEARAREAESKQAEYAAKMAETKVRSEQEVLDMEAHFQRQKEAQAEANKLAKLARYRHDIASDAKFVGRQ